MVGKDTKFKKQYIITMSGIYKKGGFTRNQTWREDITDQIMEGIVKALNLQHKTTKATLEIKKLK